MPSPHRNTGQQHTAWPTILIENFAQPDVILRELATEESLVAMPWVDSRRVSNANFLATQILHSYLAQNDIGQILHSYLVQNDFVQT